MTRVRTIALAAWGFVVGDDWATAIGVAAALVITALLAHAGVAAWWIMPLAVCLLLALSLWRVVRR